MDDFNAVNKISSHEIVINRSRFIATLSYVQNYDEAQDFIQNIKKQHQTATHNCYAFISNEVGTEQRFSDDGEPQGTAGQPMLEVLKKRNMHMTAVVVTRYFGGIKLGAGGLVSAYTRAVAEALDNAEIVSYKPSKTYDMVCDYTNYQVLQNTLKGMVYSLLSIDYGDNVTLSVAFPECCADENITNITNALCGNILIKCTDTKYEKYK